MSFLSFSNFSTGGVYRTRRIRSNPLNLLHFLVNSAMPPRFRSAIRAGALALLAAAAPALADGAVLKGTLNYHERIGLPADAQIEVLLEEAGARDAPPTLIARMVFVSAGRQVPIPFDLAYDPSKIGAGRRYQLRAAIRSHGYLLFSVASAAPALGTGAPATPAVLLLKPSPRAPAPEDAAGLEKAVWKLRLLGGAAPLPGRGTSGVEFRRDEKGAPQLSAGAGCNRILGVWREGPSRTLRILTGPTSQLKCAPELAAQEKKFLAALASTARYAVDGRLLMLKDGNGGTLATFEAELKPAP
jgi:putative lipoprotein